MNPSWVPAKVDTQGFDPRTSRMQSEQTTDCSTRPSETSGYLLYFNTLQKSDYYESKVVLGVHITMARRLASSCRPATETLDEGMVNINVPAQAATAIPTSKEYKLFYFGTIVKKPKEDALTASLGKRNSFAAADDDLKPPIAGVRLGPLLGKGSFGSVHYGTWNGAQIAVKV